MSAATVSGTLTVTRHFTREKVNGVSQDRLSLEGYQMARPCRAHFDRLGIIPDRVVVTPLARTGETARLTFPEIEPIEEPTLDYRLMAPGDTLDEREANAITIWGAASAATNLAQLVEMLGEGIGPTASMTVLADWPLLGCCSVWGP